MRGGEGEDGMGWGREDTTSQRENGKRKGREPGVGKQIFIQKGHKPRTHGKRFALNPMEHNASTGTPQYLLGFQSEPPHGYLKPWIPETPFYR